MRYMRINTIYILNDILKNNFYKNKWKLIPNNNSIVYFLKKHELIIKMYKLIDKEKIHSFDTTNFLNISVSEYSKHGYCNSYRELVLLQLMQPLIENNICIHYPILITYTRLDSECLKCQNMLKKKINLLQQKTRLRKYLQLQFLLPFRIKVLMPNDLKGSSTLVEENFRTMKFARNWFAKIIEIQSGL